MLRRSLLIGGLTLVFAAGPLWSKPGVVTTKDGASFAGDVRTDEGFVYITNKSGIETKLDRRNVASIVDVANAEEQFTKTLASLAPTDIDGRMKLARSAYDNRQYADARKALDSVMQIDPNNAAASEMLSTIEKQMRLERGAAAAGAGGAATAPPAAGGGAAGATPPAANGGGHPATGAREEVSKFLTPADVNTIRQMEWGRNDQGMRARLKGDVKKRYIEYRALDPRQFNAMSVQDQAWEILTNGTQEMRKDIEVMTDPAGLAEFRRGGVQQKVLAGCATAGCHGTAGAGGFQLFSPAENDLVAYTNFYILQQYSKTIGGRAYGMIDRTTPENSLLVQFGLPAELSEIDHPAAGTYRGIFRNRTDPTYRTVMDWMGKTLAVVVPDYGITYKPPTTQPAAAATTKPATK